MNIKLLKHIKEGLTNYPHNNYLHSHNFSYTCSDSSSSTSCTSCGENAIYNSIAGTCSCVGTSVGFVNSTRACYI